MIIKNCPDYIEAKPVYIMFDLEELPPDSSWFVKLVCGKHHKTGTIRMVALKVDLINYFG